MSCFAIATVGVRIPAAVLQQVLDNANAMSAITNKFGALVGTPARVYSFPERVSIVAGSHTLEISKSTWFITGARARQFQAEMEAYVSQMTIAVRQQQIAAALGQIAKVTNDTRD